MTQVDAATNPPPVTTQHRICPLCEACCGLELKVQAGKVISVRGHEADVFSAGYICPKGVALKELHEDPDRLRTPLIKRNGVFEAATWEEAWAEIAKRLPAVQQTHGKQSVALVAGNPSSHKMGLLLYFGRLAKALGSRHIYSAATLDQMPRHLSSGLLFGQWMSVPVPDIARMDFLLVLGANPVASNGSMWTVPDFKGKARAMQARGGQLVVIDPRQSETAALANAHHFIRPGGDVYFLLGMLVTLFDESLVRLGSVEPHVKGVAEIQNAVQSNPAFTLPLLAARCGIPAASIQSLARQLATTQRASIYARIGSCTQEFGSLSTWLVDVINTLTGHLDQEGGTMFPKAAAFAMSTAGATTDVGKGRGVVTGRHTSRVSGAPEVMGELPITCMAEELETMGPGQIKALITVATNPVLSSPNGARLSKAMQGLDFMVSLDIYLNETTRHADVILPGPSPLEDSHYDAPYPQMSWRNHARFSPAVLPRAADQPAEWETMVRLTAIVAGKGHLLSAQQLDDEHFATSAAQQFGDQSAAVHAATQGLNGPERLLDVALRSGPYGDQFGQSAKAHPQGLSLDRVRAAQAAGGIDLGPLTPRIPEMLRTPSGKIELAPPMFLNDLLRAAADLARPAPDMVIIGRRDVRSNNSWMHNLPLLAKGPMRCTALVHPEDAARLGLVDGSMARIETTAAKHNTPRHIEAQVQFSSDTMQGVISLPHGWGHDQPGTTQTLAAQRPGANLNALLDEDLRDPLSGNAVLSGVAVRLSAIV